MHSISSGIGLKDTLRAEFHKAGMSTEDTSTQQTIDNMAGYIMNSRADNTNKKYVQYFNKFEQFCEKKKFVAKPANPIQVAIYLTHLIDSKSSYSVISASLYAIKWVHQINNLPDPTTNNFVIRLLEGAKRLCSKPVVKKDVVDSEFIITLCSSFDTDDLVHLRDITMILLGYAGFLRFDEISELKCNDIHFNEDHLVLKIRRSKTDIYRAGKEVLIAKGNTIACPYNMLLKYINVSNQNITLDQYLFRPINRSKNKCKLIYKNKKISYTTARECIVKKLKSINPNLNFGIHSLRASGATMAANAEGVTERCLKRHGRWKSDQAKDGYVLDSVEKRLKITKELKL